MNDPVTLLRNTTEYHNQLGSGLARVTQDYETGRTIAGRLSAAALGRHYDDPKNRASVKAAHATLRASNLATRGLEARLRRDRVSQAFSPWEQEFISASDVRQDYIREMGFAYKEKQLVEHMKKTDADLGARISQLQTQLVQLQTSEKEPSPRISRKQELLRESLKAAEKRRASLAKAELLDPHSTDHDLRDHEHSPHFKKDEYDAVLQEAMFIMGQTNAAPSLYSQHGATGGDTNMLNIKKINRHFSNSIVQRVLVVHSFFS